MLFSPRGGTYEDGKITVCGADNIIEFGLSYGEEEIMLRTGRTTYYYYYYVLRTLVLEINFLNISTIFCGPYRAGNRLPQYIR